MVFFLRSWRSAIVVCVSIPTSLAIAMTVMKLMGLTLDTISLLGMSLVIGILVDDSTVVLENIERHFTELKQKPEDAAVSGREEIGAAAVVITLVDVVVFLPDRLHPRAGRPSALGVRDRRRDLDADVALRFVYDHADAGRTLGAQIALEAVEAGGLVRRAVRRAAHLVHAARAAVGPRSTAGSSRSSAWSTFVLAIALVPLGVVGEEFIPRDRSRRDLHPARLSDRHAAHDGRDRHLHAREEDSRATPTSSQTRRSPAPMPRRSAASSRKRTSARSTSGSRTTASIRPSYWVTRVPTARAARIVSARM